jgi:hypothetical protein
MGDLCFHQGSRNLITRGRRLLETIRNKNQNLMPIMNPDIMGMEELVQQAKIRLLDEDREITPKSISQTILSMRQDFRKR